MIRNTFHPSLVTVTLLFFWIGLSPCLVKVGCDSLSIAESKDETALSEATIFKNNTNTRLKHLVLQSVAGILNKNRNISRIAGINFSKPPSYDSVQGHDFRIPKIDIDQNRMNKYVEQRSKEMDGIQKSLNKFREIERNFKIPDRVQDRSRTTNETKELRRHWNWRIFWRYISCIVMPFLLIFSCFCRCLKRCKNRQSSQELKPTETETEMIPTASLIEDPSQQNQEQLADIGVDIECGANSPFIPRNRNSSAGPGELDSLFLFGNFENNSSSENNCDSIDGIPSYDDETVGIKTD